MNPVTGSESTMPARESTRVWRTVLVKGGNYIRVHVKVIREYVLYVVAEPRHNLPDGKKTFSILKGAVLIRNTKLDKDGHKYYMIFNDGIYSAIRSQGSHVPGSIGREGETLGLLKSSLDWGIKQSWILSKDSSEEEVDAYKTRVGDVAAQLSSVRDDDKVTARAQSAKAATNKDRLGRVNFPSRSAILWSATYRLDARVRTTKRIAPRIGTRW